VFFFKPNVCKRNGHGIIKFADGNVYEGNWKDNKLEGHGIIKKADGNVYERNWKDDKRDGHGIHKYADGSVYEGNWKDNKRDGFGIFKIADGDGEDVYEGNWKDDKRDGHGILKFASGIASGNVYEGNCLKDTMYYCWTVKNPDDWRIIHAMVERKSDRLRHPHAVVYNVKTKDVYDVSNKYREEPVRLPFLLWASMGNISDMKNWNWKDLNAMNLSTGIWTFHHLKDKGILD
jgi:hypothetical protein